MVWSLVITRGGYAGHSFYPCLYGLCDVRYNLYCLPLWGDWWQGDVVVVATCHLPHQKGTGEGMGGGGQQTEKRGEACDQSYVTYM